MPTETKYSKKQFIVMMERYAAELLQPHSFPDLPVKFAYEVSQFGKTVSCHLRTTQGVLLQVSDLVEWFEKLPENEQAEMLEPPRPTGRPGRR